MKIAFLGPQGTYSHEAAKQAFGEHSPLFATSLPEVVQRVINQEVDGAVLPIENSTNGMVNFAVDALISNCLSESPKIYISGEVRVRIKHQLYSTASHLQDITTVYSHPQVWGQSQMWLDTNLPNAKCVDAESTAHAVQIALKDPTAAALAGPDSASIEPLVANCADDPRNTTRFLVLRPAHAHPKYSSAISYKTQHVYALVSEIHIADLLAQIKSTNGQVQCLASRPSKKPWLYSYYLEITQPNSIPENWTILGHKPESRI